MTGINWLYFPHLDLRSTDYIQHQTPVYSCGCWYLFDSNICKCRRFCNTLHCSYFDRLCSSQRRTFHCFDTVLHIWVHSKHTLCMDHSQCNMHLMPQVWSLALKYWENKLDQTKIHQKKIFWQRFLSQKFASRIQIFLSIKIQFWTKDCRR